MCIFSCSVVLNFSDPTRGPLESTRLLCLFLPRQEYWSGLPFPPPRDLPNPGMELDSLASPAWAGGFFTTWPPGPSGKWMYGTPRLNLVKAYKTSFSRQHPFTGSSGHKWGRGTIQPSNTHHYVFMIHTIGRCVHFIHLDCCMEVLCGRIPQCIHSSS